MPGVPLSGYCSNLEEKEDLALLERTDPFVIPFKKSAKKAFRLKRIFFLVGASFFFLTSAVWYLYAGKSLEHRNLSSSQKFQMPLNLKNLVRREKELEQLDSLCKKDKGAIINGLGGVGKTTLAIEYAHEYQSDYEFIAFIPSGTSDLLRQELLKLADRLQVPDGKPNYRLEKLKGKLAEFKGEYLLIFDGVDHIESLKTLGEFLPQQGETVIVTSRISQELANFRLEKLPLYLFSEEQALDYFYKAIEVDDLKEAKVLAEKLGYLPLALEQAAAYIRSRGFSIAKYNKQLESYGLNLFENKQLGIVDRNEKTLLTTWLITVDALEADHKCYLARKLLSFFSFLEKAPIPLFLIEEWVSIAEKENMELEIGNSLRLLLNYSLISSPYVEHYSVHPLVQKVIRYEMPAADQNFLLSKGLNTFVQIYAKYPPGGVENKKVVDEITPHCEAFLRHFQKTKGVSLEQCSDESLAFASLLDGLYTFYYTYGGYKKGKSYAMEGLELRRKIYGKKKIHPNIARSLNQVGWSYHVLGEVGEALGCFKESLSMYRAIYGKSANRPEIAMGLNNVGWNYFILGKMTKGLTFFEEALDMYRALYGEKANHPDIATSLISIGIVYSDLGELRKGLAYKKQSLSMRQALYGKEINDHDIATNLNHIGWDYYRLGEAENALECFKKALKMYQALYGESKEHPYTAWCYVGIGESYYVLKEPIKALDHYEKGVKMYNALYREEADHPYIVVHSEDHKTDLSAIREDEKYLRSHSIPLLQHVIECMNRAGEKRIVEKAKKEFYPLCKKILGEKHELTEAVLKAGNTS